MLTDPIKVLVSRIWNATIILMYCEHLLRRPCPAACSGPISRQGCQLDAMSTLTVLPPHYGRGVILLKYLKQLHPIEWENFVNNTMILAEGQLKVRLAILLHQFQERCT
jgi:hypothetical protein